LSNSVPLIKEGEVGKIYFEFEFVKFCLREFLTAQPTSIYNTRKQDASYIIGD